MKKNESNGKKPNYFLPSLKSFSSGQRQDNEVSGLDLPDGWMRRRSGSFSVSERSEKSTHLEFERSRFGSLSFPLKDHLPHLRRGP